MPGIRRPVPEYTEKQVKDSLRSVLRVADVSKSVKPSAVELLNKALKLTGEDFKKSCVGVLDSVEKVQNKLVCQAKVIIRAYSLGVTYREDRHE